MKTRARQIHANRREGREHAVEHDSRRDDVGRRETFRECGAECRVVIREIGTTKREHPRLVRSRRIQRNAKRSSRPRQSVVGSASRKRCDAARPRRGAC